MNQTRRRLIRASEIGRFVYCRRAWWLAAVAGEKPANTHQLARGSVAHAAHGRTVIGERMFGWLALLLMVAAAALLLFAR